MSAFRNKYTSARKLAFRSPTKHGDGTSHAVSDIDNDTSPSSVGAGTVLIEIQFTGPQPIEGPAGLLCTLVQGTFVEAHPIQLGRGRKRKIQAGGGPASPGFSFASAPGGSGELERRSLRSAMWLRAGGKDIKSRSISPYRDVKPSSLGFAGMELVNFVHGGTLRVLLSWLSAPLAKDRTLRSAGRRFSGNSTLRVVLVHTLFSNEPALLRF